MQSYTQQKVYKITYGSTPFREKRSFKEIFNSDNTNVDSITVIARNVYEALEKTEKVMLAKEKEWLENYEQLFVESVELLNVIDDMDKL